MKNVQRPVSIEDIATKAMGTSRPVIGIVPTYDPNEGILRMNNHYAQAVVAAGGAPLIVPFTSDVSVYESLLPRIDGFVLSGGQDISPVRYGGDITYGKLSELTPEREEVEYLLLSYAYQFDYPLLGICRGMQVLNVALGGTLYQDVHACGLTDAAHQQKPPYDVVRQRVDIAPGSVLDRVLCDGAGEGMVPGCKAGWPASLETSWEGIAPAPHSLLVNTMHHQAIACVADPLQVSAVSGDGLVEGLEDPSRRFYLGVQWHPEYLDDNVPLFEALVAAAK